MDLTSVAHVVVARRREDVVVSKAVAALAGGTWLYSEPQPHLTGLVDLTGLGWTPWQARDDGGLSLAATCTIADLVAIPAAPRWRALPLFRASSESLLQSFKIWNTATIGGNIATALAAGALIGLTAALDGDIVIWMPDGGERHATAREVVLAERTTSLGPGEIIRSIEFSAAAMAARTAFRRIALSPLGRAGTVVAARMEADGTTVFAVTGGTTRPEVLRFAGPPTAGEVAAAVAAIPSWFTDAHGAADWRAAMTALFAEQIRVELGDSA